mmetsp:Transcript_14959/g.24452  ORF Transcript_14959/g.24452 Transcript_14959/m.24452 type:complete len:164 (+) Transcript_14959:2-493(+)
MAQVRLVSLSHVAASRALRLHHRGVATAATAAANRLRGHLAQRQIQFAKSVTCGDIPASASSKNYAAVVSVDERVSAERDAETEVRQAIGGSLLGLYPAYEVQYMERGTFIGVQVAAPSPLRFALSQAKVTAPRAGSDGRMLLSSDADTFEDDEIDEDVEDED